MPNPATPAEPHSPENLRLYLDIDGVINVRTDSSDELERLAARTGWPSFTRTQAIVGSETVTLIWAPELIRSLNSLHDQGAELVWLSTWREQAVAFADVVGLPKPLRHIRFKLPLDPDMPILAAKRAALENDFFAFPTRRTTFWIDDELNRPDWREVFEIRAALTTIAPDPELGLLPSDLAAIRGDDTHVK